MYQQDIVRMVMMHYLNHSMKMYQVYIALKHKQTRIVSDLSTPLDRNIFILLLMWNVRIVGYLWRAYVRIEDFMTELD